MNKDTKLDKLLKLSDEAKYNMLLNKRRKDTTERGSSVVMHETHIREVLGSNPVTGQPG